MAVEVTMPKLGLNMTEGSLVRWLVADGASVSKGQPIFELETEKVTNDVEAESDGVLHHVVEAGSTIPVAGLVGYILEPGEEPPADLQPPPGRGVTPGAPSQAASGEVAPSPDEVRASPLARRLAREAGIDLAAIKGSGEGGRIAKQDVERAIAERAEKAESAVEAEETVADERVTPIEGVRAVIAERMLTSSQQTASVTITTEVDATELVNMRTQLNEGLEGQLGFTISYNDILVKIVARALREFPYMNARQEGDVIRQQSEVNVGVAVDTERGLLVPVVHYADKHSLIEVTKDLRKKVTRAAQGKSLPDELSGGTFTITNLGMLDVDAFTPIINPPEIAILGIGRILQKPVSFGGEIRLRERTTLSLTFDHRLVDGAPAARFLQRITALMEKPYLLMVNSVSVAKSGDE